MHYFLRVRQRITQPVGFVCLTCWIGTLQDSSTKGLHLPKLSLAVMVLIDDVNTTFLTELDFKHDFRTFKVPSMAGSIIFSSTYLSSS